MNEKHWKTDNIGHPVIFRIAHQRDEGGTAADSDIIITDRGEQQRERYALHYQRLDNGLTYSGLYDDRLWMQINRAIRMSHYSPIREVFDFLKIEPK